MSAGTVTESMVVEVSPEQFRQVLADYERFPEFLEELTRCRVDEVKGLEYTVTYFAKVMGREISYTLRLLHEPHKGVSWTLVRGDLMRRNAGSWSFQELAPGRTRVTYTIELDLGLFVPGALVRRVQQSTLPKTLAAFKQRAERLYGTAGR